MAETIGAPGPALRSVVARPAPASGRARSDQRTVGLGQVDRHPTLLMLSPALDGLGRRHRPVQRFRRRHRPGMGLLDG
ncbi:MAG: hypothetical protein ACR2QK_05735, partial [Acidimicrobiales bacterium]